MVDFKIKDLFEKKMLQLEIARGYGGTSLGDDLVRLGFLWHGENG